MVRMGDLRKLIGARKRVVVYVTPREHAALKRALAKEGVSVSWWVRRMIQRRLAEK